MEQLFDRSSGEWFDVQVWARLIIREIEGLSYGHLLVYFKLKEQLGTYIHDSAISALHLTDETL